MAQQLQRGAPNTIAFLRGNYGVILQFKPDTVSIAAHVGDVNATFDVPYTQAAKAAKYVGNWVKGR